MSGRPPRKGKGKKRPESNRRGRIDSGGGSNGRVSIGNCGGNGGGSGRTSSGGWVGGGSCDAAKAAFLDAASAVSRASDPTALYRAVEPLLTLPYPISGVGLSVSFNDSTCSGRLAAVLEVDKITTVLGFFLLCCVLSCSFTHGFRIPCLFLSHFARACPPVSKISARPTTVGCESWQSVRSWCGAALR
jgi:hypothetical protein